MKVISDRLRKGGDGFPLDLPPASVMADVIAPIDVTTGQEAAAGTVVGITTDSNGKKIVGFISSSLVTALGLPATQRGDLLYAIEADVLSRIAIGSSGTFLASDGNLPAWRMLATSDIDVSLVTQHQASLVIDWSQLTGIPTRFYVESGSVSITGTAADLQSPSIYMVTAITKASGGTLTGTYDYLHEMCDGNTVQLLEEAATPGFELTIDFGYVIHTPSYLAIRGYYEGSGTHDVTIDIYKYNGSTYVQLHKMVTDTGYRAFIHPLPRNLTDYMSSGAMKFRIIHNSAGNPAHDLHLDYFALVR